MANHKTHQKGAIAAGIIGAITSFVLGMISLPQMLIVFIAGYTGGMAPDLDHDQAKALKACFRLLSFSIPALILYRHPEYRSDITQACMYFTAMAFILYVPVQFLFKKLTVHRGIFHSIPAAIIYGELFFLLVGKHAQSLSLQKAAGITAGLGYFLHLLLDEYYSVGFNGIHFKVKRSLGTAIDFIKPNKMVTVLAYSLLVFLLIPIYRQW